MGLPRTLPKCDGARCRRAGYTRDNGRRMRGGTETLHPRDVLEFQEKHADVAFTLDFPVPPAMTAREGRRRLDLTVANARWAIDNRRRRDMLLYACVQGWDLSTVMLEVCRSLALGCPSMELRLAASSHACMISPRYCGSLRLFVPKFRTNRCMCSVSANPESSRPLFSHGVQSVDSSSYVKLAADGKLWGPPEPEPSGCITRARRGFASSALQSRNGCAASLATFNVASSLRVTVMGDVAAPSDDLRGQATVPHTLRVFPFKTPAQVRDNP